MSDPTHPQGGSSFQSQSQSQSQSSGNGGSIRPTIVVASVLGIVAAMAVDFVVKDNSGAMLNLTILVNKATNTLINADPSAPTDLLVAPWQIILVLILMAPIATFIYPVKTTQAAFQIGFAVLASVMTLIPSTGTGTNQAAAPSDPIDLQDVVFDEEAALQVPGVNPRGSDEGWNLAALLVTPAKAGPPAAGPIAAGPVAPAPANGSPVNGFAANGAGLIQQVAGQARARRTDVLPVRLIVNLPAGQSVDDLRIEGWINNYATGRTYTLSSPVIAENGRSITYTVSVPLGTAGRDSAVRIRLEAPGYSIVRLQSPMPQSGPLSMSVTLESSMLPLALQRVLSPRSF